MNFQCNKETKRKFHLRSALIGFLNKMPKKTGIQFLDNAKIDVIINARNEKFLMSS